MTATRKLSRYLNSFILLTGITATSLCLGARFQAEDYAYAWDSTTGNIGNVYRSGDVDIQATSDTGGGYNVGWVEPTEWLSFSGLSIPTTGDYRVSARVASMNGGTLSLDLNAGSIKLADLSFNGTGGWQTWKTVSSVVRINAGNYNLGVFATTGGWNLNWVEIVSCQQVGCGLVIPGRVEAEQYTGFSDTTQGNTGGALRNDNVDIEVTSDSGGGYNVGWIAPGEYLRYNVNVSTRGRYRITARVSSPVSGKSFRLKINGQNLGSSIAVPNSGGWQSWRSQSIEVVLDAGVQELETYFDSGEFNFNYLDFEYLGPDDTPTTASLKVMTYNVRTTPAGGDTGERYWDNRRAELVRAIQSQLPEIIGMQELTGLQHDYIKASLGSAWSSSPQRQIIYRGDRFDILQSGLINLVADVWGNRTCEWIKLRRKSDGREFVFFNTHWGVDGTSQQGSANILRDTMGTINQNWTIPSVLLGDLNAVPGSGPINTLSTQTPLISFFSGNTFNDWQPTASVQLDYIFINKFTKTGCSLITYREGSLPPSDHFPIFCELKFQ